MTEGQAVNTPRSRPCPAKPCEASGGAGRRRSLLVLWSVALGVLVAVGLVCWLVVRSPPPSPEELGRDALALVSGHCGPDHIGPEAHRALMERATRNARALNRVLEKKYLGAAFETKRNSSLYVVVALEVTARGDAKGSLRLARQLARQLESALSQLRRDGPHKALDAGDTHEAMMSRLEQQLRQAGSLVSNLERELGLSLPGEQPL